MAYIAAAGKLGVKQALPYLAPYVEGSITRNRLQRDNAIWALMNVGWTSPDKVRSLKTQETCPKLEVMRLFLKTARMNCPIGMKFCSHMLLMTKFQINATVKANAQDQYFVNTPNSCNIWFIECVYGSLADTS